MRYIIVIFVCSFTTIVQGQVGGNHSFDFLRMPAHARGSALGGVNVSLADKDVNFFHNNPALTGDTLNGYASVAYQFYLAGIGNALLTYAHDFPRLGQFVMGIQHTDYGSLPGYDESGNATTHDVDAGETAILLGKTHGIGNFRLGVSLKAVFSTIAGYRANALLADVGGVFKHPDSDLTVGLAVKNLGVVLDHYGDMTSTRLPFDVQAGVTFKPEYMPVRFSLTAYNLVAADGLSTNQTTGVASTSAVKKFLRHINAGAEILLHRHVNALLGYNYLLRQALQWETNAVAGVSYGVSIWVKPVEFVFSRSAYVVGNAGYSFTLSTNTNQLLKRKNF